MITSRRERSFNSAKELSVDNWDFGVYLSTRKVVLSSASELNVEIGTPVIVSHRENTVSSPSELCEECFVTGSSRFQLKTPLGFFGAEKANSFQSNPEAMRDYAN
ncbi:hypothetical protein TNCV_3787861 [Trichonephila clavipes]|nr:hypothetical protein TNCV_3787861 [Trichonephila clavipes]